MNAGTSLTALTVMLTVASEESSVPSLTLNLKESPPLKLGFGVYVTVAVHVLVGERSGAEIVPSEPLSGASVTTRRSGRCRRHQCRSELSESPCLR